MTVAAPGPAPRRSHLVPSALDRIAAYSWRLIVVAVAAWGLIRLLSALRLVVFPLIVATFLTVVLGPTARWLRLHGWPPLLAAWAVFLGFLGTIALGVAAIVPPLADEFAELGPTVQEGIEAIETWIVEESPFDVDRARLAELREQGARTLRRSLASSGGVAFRGAVLFAEVVAALILSLVLTFFFVKDGERFQRWALSELPAERRELVRRLAKRAWTTVAGYLRGSAMLGVIEATIIGITLALVSAGLIVPVVVLTFAAAFVPFVGAAVAGIVAVLVTMVTAGFVKALIVAAVALTVQQLDNDLLAPVVFGKALDLHPVIVILAVAGGATLGGLAGAFLAVPLTATVINVVAEGRSAMRDGGWRTTDADSG